MEEGRHYKCKKCDVELYIDPRFELYRTLSDYQIYYEIKLKVAVKFLLCANNSIQNTNNINK